MCTRALVLSCVFLVVSAGGALAKCDPAGGDAADVAAARVAVAASCQCSTAPNHGTYVRCARAAAKSTLANPSCLGTVMRCESRSTCGRPSAVACCQTAATGVTRASIKSSAAACRVPRGGSACVSSFASICDACTATGCAVATPAPTATPQPNICGNGIVDPGEECDGPTCTAIVEGIAQTSECGAPGTLHACQCRDAECGFLPGAVLCWDSDQCLPQPGEIGGGTCIPTICQSTSDCSEPAQCENGACCIPLSSGSACSFDQIVSLPCCGSAICVAGSPYGYCCLPSGEACGGDAECCDGTCSGNTCN